MTAKTKLYNWDTIVGETVRPGVARKGFRGDQVIIVMNTLETGMELSPHSHPFDQIVYITQGQIKYHVGDEVHDGGPGSLIHIPANVEHYAEPYGDEPVLNLDVFSPVREDYKHLVEYQGFEEEGGN